MSQRISRNILRRALIAITVAITSIAVIATTTSLSAQAAAHGRFGFAGDGSPNDPNIKYIGRWDTSSSTVHTSYWVATYFKTIFIGRTVKIKLAASVNFYASIDGGDDQYYPAASGTIDLTPTPLRPGIHTLRVAARAEHDTIQFQGLVLDPGAFTLPAITSPKHIEFIGDSVTAGATDTKASLSDYAWLVGEQLHVEHTQIAQGGICLVDQVQCGVPTPTGMSSQYFKMKTVYFPNSPNWDFSRYRANVVVINLGTNDSGYHVTDATFQATYITFLQNIRAKYPHAAIFALRPFKGSKAAATQAAVAAVNAAGDHNVRYIDTTGWLSPSDYNSGPHPSDEGQMKVANLLAPILAPYV